MSKFVTDHREISSEESDRENSDEGNQILKCFLKKYKNFLNLGARNFDFPK